MTRYVHDCENCTYLGEFGTFDLYHCDTGTAFPTVIARYGNEGENYKSGMSGLDPELIVAKFRARQRGLRCSI